MKRKLLLAIGLLAILFSSCKKEPTADFDYYLENHYTWQDGEYVTDYVTVYTENHSINANEYSWEFFKPPYGIGGTIYNEKNPSFVCSKSGDYTLSLTVSNKSLDTDTKTVQFHISLGGSENPSDPNTPSGPPTANFNINSSNGIYAPSVVSCNNTSINATHYQWTLTLPDNTSATSTNKNPSFLCSLSGTYTIRLVAYNANNESHACEQQFTLATPSNFTITWLRLETIPMIDGNNASWDTGTFTGADPDIFFTITEDNSTTVLYQSDVKNETAASDFPVTWSPVNQILSYNNNYVVKFWDHDDLTLDGNDLMASCLLNMSHIEPGSSSYTWNNNNMGVRFVIGLSWSN